MGYAEWEHLKAQLVRGVRSPGCVIGHIGFFLVASTILVLVNAITSAGELWFWRPLLILAGVLALHIGLVVATGPSSRLRVAAARVGSLWSGWLASRPRRAETDAPSPVLAKVDAEAISGPAVTPYGSWPTAWPNPAAGGAAVTATAWPESAPAWTASWPAPPALAPTVASQARASNNGTAPNGAHGVEPAHPHPHPTWDQLEVAAASWLAQRAAEPVAETAR